MQYRNYGLFAIIGPMLIFFSIIVSLIFSSSWFDWGSNILSDLGNPNFSNLALFFNSGLFIGGFFLLIYSITALKAEAKQSSYCLFISTFFILLLAIFNISYGVLHNFLAVFHFIMLSITSIVYFLEKKSIIAISTLIVVLFIWLIYFLGFLNIGISFPEAMSKIVLFWIMYSGFSFYNK